MSNFHYGSWDSSVDSLYGCRLPFQIGWRVPEEAYNTFLEKTGSSSTGYKFYWKMETYISLVWQSPSTKPLWYGYLNTLMFQTVALMMIHHHKLYFDHVRIPGSSFSWSLNHNNILHFFTVYFDPSGVRVKTAADIAICPNINLIQEPLNPGPPPGDANVH